MNTLQIAGAIALFSVATGAHAADLITTTAPSATIEAPVLSGFYAQVYGGAALGGRFTWDPIGAGSSGFNDQDLGWAAGGTLGWNTGLDGLSVEFDVLRASRREAAPFANVGFDTTSAMVDAKYSFQLSDGFEVYAGAGLGAIDVSYISNSGTTFSGWGLGYQAMAGAALKLTDTASAFAEYRYQNTFGGVDIGLSSAFHVPTSEVLAGLKFKF